jgi:hypothetical protein
VKRNIGGKKSKKQAISPDSKKGEKRCDNTSSQKVTLYKEEDPG